MGNGMNKIITGVYVGNFRDAKDLEQLNKHEITHILSVHDNAKELIPDRKYLCIIASDTPEQKLSQFFQKSTEFIHEARLNNGRVLVHCLAGVSRSVTLTAAYIMTVTQLGWRDTINAIRGARNCANPNFGFQKQLQEFENDELEEARKKLKEKYPDNPFDDEKECDALLKCFRHFVQTGETKSFSELYNLPHNAYGDRKKKNNQSDSSTSEGCVTEKRTGCDEETADKC